MIDSQLRRGIMKSYKDNALDEEKDDSYFQLAIKAKDYARQIVLKGATQVENNELQKKHAVALSQGIVDVMQINSIRLESDLYVYEFENNIARTTKFSLGNCFELAEHALDYFVSEVPDEKVEAEIFHISGSDHAFLVVGRPPKSDPNDPSTWGKKAVICDPWANKVFYADHWLTELRGYKYKLGILDNIKTIILPSYIPHYKNETESFDPLKHTLKPIKGCSTSYLGEARTIVRLKKHVIDKIYLLLNEAQEYKQKLATLMGNIIKEHGKDDNKAKELQKKIIELDNFIKNCQDNDIPSIKDQRDNGSYRQTRNHLIIYHQTRCCGKGFDW